MTVLAYILSASTCFCFFGTTVSCVLRRETKGESVRFSHPFTTISLGADSFLFEAHLIILKSFGNVSTPSCITFRLYTYSDAIIDNCQSGMTWNCVRYCPTHTSRWLDARPLAVTAKRRGTTWCENNRPHRPKMLMHSLYNLRFLFIYSPPPKKKKIWI